jgi:hypothetical protein
MSQLMKLRHNFRIYHQETRRCRIPEAHLTQMGMRWLYICLGILGALAPAGIFYALNYERRIPGAAIDLGLLLFSAGLSILFIL